MANSTLTASTYVDSSASWSPVVSLFFGDRLAAMNGEDVFFVKNGSSRVATFLWMPMLLQANKLLSEMPTWRWGTSRWSQFPLTAIATPSSTWRPSTQSYNCTAGIYYSDCRQNNRHLFQKSPESIIKFWCRGHCPFLCLNLWRVGRQFFLFSWLTFACTASGLISHYFCRRIRLFVSSFGHPNSSFLVIYWQNFVIDQRVWHWRKKTYLSHLYIWSVVVSFRVYAGWFFLLDISHDCHDRAHQLALF